MATCPQCHKVYSGGERHCIDDGQSLLPGEPFVAVDRDLIAGDRVGEYEVEAKIGEGGFGTVYRAKHPVIGKRAAVKVLNRQFSSNPEMVSRFISEARAVNQIQHRNIIDIFAFGALPDGRQYYVMELLQGEPLDQLLERVGRLDMHLVVSILRRLSKALDAAHKHGIAHRDLKPENVFLVNEDDGSLAPKLLDFGIAKLLSDEGEIQHKTKTGMPIGTPSYMSPEQCRGRGVDHRTDIYSFGIVAYRMITGRLPFDGDHTMDILFKQMDTPAPRPSAVCADLRSDFDEPILWMLRKDPNQRPPTLSAAVDALAQAAGIVEPVGTPHNVTDAAVAAIERTREMHDQTTAQASQKRRSKSTALADTLAGLTDIKGRYGPIKRVAWIAIPMLFVAIGAMIFFSGDRKPSARTPKAAEFVSAPPATSVSVPAPAQTQTQTQTQTPTQTPTQTLEAKPETVTKPATVKRVSPANSTPRKKSRDALENPFD